MFLFHDLWWTTWVYDLWAHGSYAYTLSLFKIYMLEPKTCMWFIDDNILCKTICTYKIWVCHVRNMFEYKTQSHSNISFYMYTPYVYWMNSYKLDRVSISAVLMHTHWILQGKKTRGRFLHVRKRTH